jgi:hypothetical protein
MSMASTTSPQTRVTTAATPARQAFLLLRVGFTALRDVGLLLGALALTRLAAPHTSA